ncbi:putative variant ionotropic glutamate receptor-like 6, partial [Homarus americanus]
MVINAGILWCVLTAAVTDVGTAQLFLPSVGRKVVVGLSQAVTAVLNATTETNCSSILFTDGVTYHTTIYEMWSQLVAPWGVAVFEVAVDGQDANVTQAQLSRAVDEARQLRQVSWCVTVVVVSDDPAFLAAFAEWSLKGRLLVWSTRLLVVTRLPAQEIRSLLKKHWCFSMMNTVMMKVQDLSQTIRCGVYLHLPYSPRGAKVVQVAQWSPLQGLVYTISLPLFPEKFSNFYGARVNVTALPYAPYWMTSGEGNNTKHSGIDYNQ